MTKGRSPRSIRYQAQEYDHGCALACLAMILGKKQEDLNKEFLVDFSRKGLPIKMAIEFLMDSGLSVIEKRCSSFIDRKTHNRRMLEPFAHAHYLSMQQFVDAPTHHAAVMDAKGRIFDPGSKTTKGEDFYYVQTVLGVFWD